MPTDTHMSLYSKRELKVKEWIANRLEAMDKDHKDTMNTSTTNLKALSFSIAATVLVAKANPNPNITLLQPVHISPSRSSMYCQPPSRSVPTPAASSSKSAGYDSAQMYSQVLFDTDSGDS